MATVGAVLGEVLIAGVVAYVFLFERPLGMLCFLLGPGRCRTSCRIYYSSWFDPIEPAGGAIASSMLLLG